MEDRNSSGRGRSRSYLAYQLIVVLYAAFIYLGCVISPPSLMDDVDAVQAQIARNMLESGDWVSARLDGVLYLEKSPMQYWMMAVSYAIFGVHDWAARLPLALAVIALCWLTVRFGAWAFSELVGFYAGMTMATCIGLWLFTRIQIPDAVLTLTIALALWAFLRVMDSDEKQPRLWAAVMAASIGVGLLLKGLIAALFPVAAAGLYLLFTKQVFVWETWKRLQVVSGLAIIFVIAAPWHILAMLRNPPYVDLTMSSEPFTWRGFFWFYFLNEHVFRFLNIRHPRDYNTVPRVLFWGFHLLWLFPSSAFFPGIAKLSYRPADRASRTRLLLACWAGFLLVFFTFSTTQEYYSMPCYPALALLLGCVMAEGGKLVRIGSRAVGVVAALAALAIAAILFNVWNVPTPGDISQALTQHPDAYTLSLGHMGDLTVESFAYLRLPLIIAGIAFIVGTVAAFRAREVRLAMGLGLMMVLFFHAARLALVVFDPYMGSRPLAEALLKAPPGNLIVDNQYYTFSSVFFYTNRQALLLNGRVNNLEYGSYAPRAPQIFIDDSDFTGLWRDTQRYYLLAEGPAVPRIEKLVGKDALRVVAASGGKFLFTNR